MKGNKLSLYLSLAVCIFSCLLFVVLLFAFPAFFEWIILKGKAETDILRNIVDKVTLAFYIASPFAAAALYMLIRLLINIKNGKVFVEKNVFYLKLLPICCYAVMIISIIFMFTYTSMFIVAFIMAVVGTLLLVVKDIMQSAVAIKNENDLTI